MNLLLLRHIGFFRVRFDFIDREQPIDTTVAVDEQEDRRPLSDESGNENGIEHLVIV